MSMSYHHHRTEINFMCYYGLSNAFKCNWSENDVCGIISVATVTDANFTEVLEIQISLLVISISLNLKVQSPITASRFTGAQRMLCATPLKKSAITIYVIIHLHVHLALDYPYLTAKFQRLFYQQFLLYIIFILRLRWQCVRQEIYTHLYLTKA